jgi:hypothetical protein
MGVDLLRKDSTGQRTLQSLFPYRVLAEWGDMQHECLGYVEILDSGKWALEFSVQF